MLWHEAAKLLSDPQGFQKSAFVRAQDDAEPDARKNSIRR